MAIKKVDVLQPLFERLKLCTQKDTSRALIYGVASGFDVPNPIAVTMIHYSDNEAIKLAERTLPYGLTLIGVVEFETDEDQEVYAMLDQIENPVLIKVMDGKISSSTGLDFLTSIHLNIISRDELWGKTMCTFRIQGKFLLSSLLEIPDLQDCFNLAKSRVLNQAAYTVGKKSIVTILPKNGCVITDKASLKSKENWKVSDLVKCLKSDIEEVKEKNVTYFCPEMSLIEVNMLHDQTKSNSSKRATVIIADKSARCKFFEHYVNIDVLVLTPSSLSAQKLYRKFNEAVKAQLESGFHENIIQQLGNSISAEKPEVFHFWPSFGQHFLSVLYPQNTSEEKLNDKRHELHDLYFARETRPYFRRPASVFQPTSSLISPHVSLRGNFSETEIIKGHYEYKHYMQEDFNDDGWGCAYRSLQTIISWFRIQGFTARKVPTHREIQECLVSLGDKPPSFVGSKQWIGSTEVAFVLEALLGISCRIVALSSGGEMASRVSDLMSHFKIHGTPVMIGGGVLAHTLIGSSRDIDSDSNINYLVLDPHYTGRDDLKTILSKGWVGWKDNNFWSKKDFYNMCMPLLPSAI